MNHCIALSINEVVDCRISLMHIWKMKGLPCIWSFGSNDWDVDWSIVKQLHSWESKDGMIMYLEWSTITPLGDNHE